MRKAQQSKKNTKKNFIIKRSNTNVSMTKKHIP